MFDKIDISTINVLIAEHGNDIYWGAWNRIKKELAGDSKPPTNKQSLKCLCEEDISGAKNMKYLHLVKDCPIHGHEWEE